MPLVIPAKLLVEDVPLGARLKRTSARSDLRTETATQQALPRLAALRATLPLVVRAILLEVLVLVLVLVVPRRVGVVKGRSATATRLDEERTQRRPQHGCARGTSTWLLGKAFARWDWRYPKASAASTSTRRLIECCW